MENKLSKPALITIALLLAVAFAFGRYLTPARVETQEKIVYIEKSDKTTETETDKKKHTVTTKVEMTAPDGTKTITTRTEENTDLSSKTKSRELVDKSKTSDKQTIVETGNKRLTIAALGGLNLTDLTKPPVFGAHVSKPVLGPITVGAWGLSSGQCGVSLGLQF